MAVGSRSRMFSGIRRRSRNPVSWSSVATDIDLRSDVSPLLNASSFFTSAPPRRDASSIALRSSCTMVESSGSCSRTSGTVAVMTVSKLLKSCAMPPVN